MNIINYSDFQNQLDKILDQVNNDHKPVIVNSDNGKSVVVISAEDFNRYEQIALICSSSDLI